MSQNEANINQLHQLRNEFAGHLTDQIASLAHELEHLQNGWQIETLENIRAEAHRIAGGSLSLGYTRIGISAQAIESTARELLAQPTIDLAGLNAACQSIQKRIDVIRQAILKDKSETLAVAASVPAESIIAVPSLQDSRAGRLIYLVEDDPTQAQEIARQIGYFGYTVKVFNHLSEVEEAALREQPAVILMDVIFPEGDSAGAEVISALQKKLPPETQVIFLSVRDDFQIRLKAARAGGKAYFCKPVNIGALIEVLDRLLSAEEKPPYRILIVDDDHVQATVNSLHLKRAGMEITTLTDPMNILQVLHEFNPDLILLDMYMPECSGMELAVIIRQIESFVSIPIVYLSAETDRSKQLEAVGLGGDDFLTKPIKPEHLISAVTSRVDRYRQLRYLMMRDSLTGLLNHTTLKERYAQEINRAIRHNTPLAYAMLDLDSFKNVNDTYGHSAGDRVIKSLSSMLRKRLRNSDIIGRYGGEEFAIVLPNTNSEEAAHILDELRESFAHIPHRAAGSDFTVTFSCGVASFPQRSTPLELAEAADKALYAAKKQGRNRVVIG